MKLPKFNDNAMRWDAWRAFYCEPAPNMVLFKTGDAVLTSAEFEPRARGRALGEGSDLRVFRRSDRHLPKLRFDPKVDDWGAVSDRLRSLGYSIDKLLAKPVPVSWLAPGTLLVDNERACGLSHRHEERHAAWSFVSGRLSQRRCVAYLPGDGRPAVGGKIKLRVPKKFGRAHYSALRRLREVCEIWAGMGDWSLRVLLDGEPPGPASPYDIPDVVPQFSDLPNAEKYRIAMHGFKPPSVHEVLVDWLRVV